MTPTNILQRTYQIQYKENLGTCFTIDKDKRQYIISARHVLDGISNEDIVEIYNENQWKKLKVRLVGVGQNEFDITVLTTDVQISPCHPILPTKLYPSPLSRHKNGLYLVD